MIKNDLYARLPFIVLPIEDEAKSITRELLLDYTNKELYIKGDSSNIKIGESKLKELISDEMNSILGVGGVLNLEELVNKITELNMYMDNQKDLIGNNIDSISKILSVFSNMDSNKTIKARLDELQDISFGMLSTNNFTNALKIKLDGISNKANKYLHPIEKQCDYETKLFSVSSKTGVVLITKEDLGLGLVEPGANLYAHPDEKQCGKGVVTVFGKGGKKFISYNSNKNSGCSIDSENRLYIWGDYYKDSIFDISKYYIDVDTSGTTTSAAIYKDGTIVVNSNIADLVTGAPTNDEYSKISCGSSHIAALRNGEVIVWGPPQDDIDKSPKDSNIKGVMSYDDRMLVIKDDNTIKLWGYHTPIDANETVPTNKFKSICIANKQYGGITETGQIKIWGKSNIVSTNVISGNNFIGIGITEKCGVAIRNTGKLVVWGDKNDPVYRNLPIKGGFVSIKCGDNHCTALSNQGVLTTWGSDINNQITDTPSTQIDIQIEKHHLGLPFLQNLPVADNQAILDKVNDKYITTQPGSIHLDDKLSSFDIDANPLIRYSIIFTVDPVDADVYLLIKGKWVFGKEHINLYPGRYMYKANTETDKMSGVIIISNSDVIKHLQVQRYELVFTSIPASAIMEIEIDNKFTIIGNSIKVYPGVYNYKLRYADSYTKIEGIFDVTSSACSATFTEYHDMMKYNGFVKYYNVMNKYDIKHELRMIFTLNVTTSPTGAIVRHLSRNQVGGPFRDIKGRYKYNVSLSGYVPQELIVNLDRNKTEHVTLVVATSSIITFNITPINSIINMRIPGGENILFDSSNSFSSKVDSGMVCSYVATSTGYLDYTDTITTSNIDTTINVNLIKVVEYNMIISVSQNGINLILHDDNGVIITPISVVGNKYTYLCTNERKYTYTAKAFTYITKIEKTPNHNSIDDLNITINMQRESKVPVVFTVYPKDVKVLVSTLDGIQTAYDSNSYTAHAFKGETISYKSEHTLYKNKSGSHTVTNINNIPFILEYNKGIVKFNLSSNVDVEIIVTSSRDAGYRSIANIANGYSAQYDITGDIYTYTMNNESYHSVSGTFTPLTPTHNIPVDITEDIGYITKVVGCTASIYGLTSKGRLVGVDAGSDHKSYPYKTPDKKIINIFTGKSADTSINNILIITEDYSVYTLHNDTYKKINVPAKKYVDANHHPRLGWVLVGADGLLELHKTGSYDLIQNGLQLGVNNSYVKVCLMMRVGVAAKTRAFSLYEKWGDTEEKAYHDINTTVNISFNPKQTLNDDYNMVTVYDNTPKTLTVIGEITATVNKPPATFSSPITVLDISRGVVAIDVGGTVKWYAITDTAEHTIYGMIIRWAPVNNTFKFVAMTGYNAICVGADSNGENQVIWGYGIGNPTPFKWYLIK